MNFLLGLLVIVAAPGLLDGNGAEHPPVCEDRKDGSLLELRAAAMGDGLWIGMEFDRVIAADAGSGLVLHIDADADASTGDRDGCELVLDLQARNGSLHPRRELPGTGRLFQRLGIKLAPAFDADRCEVLIPRRIRGGDSLFTGSELRFFVVHAGDRAPDTGWIPLRWEEETIAFEPVPLERAEGAWLRIAAWNLKRDGLFEEDSAAAQRRLLTTLDADVLVLGENFRHDADQVQSRVNSLLGTTTYAFAEKADPGNVVLSRFGIGEAWSILDGPDRYNGHRVSAVRIATPTGDLLVLPQHWRCCNKEGQRLFEADSVIGFLRDAFTEGGNFTLATELPFVICGDLNLVNTRRPLDVLLTGKVVDQDSYGPDFAAGPGRTPLRAVTLQHNEAPFTHTWHSPDSRYYPARLDWVVVPAGVEVLRGFILDTGTLSTATLHQRGLQRTDSAAASDHTPVVVDLRW